MLTKVTEREVDTTYAIDQLRSGVPVEDVLLDIYNRATSAPDPAGYAVAIIAEARIDLDIPRAVLPPNTQSGSYNGVILHADEEVTLQASDPRIITIHRSRDLTPSCLKSQNCCIRYANGSAVVHRRENERDARER